jgi:hypothetical protein
MSAVLLKAIELHRRHRAIPLWQCIELAKDLEAPSSAEPARAAGEPRIIAARRRFARERARPLPARAGDRSR